MLDIKVCGVVGTGKTTVARIISEALFKQGFNVWVKMDDNDCHDEELFEKCKKALRGTEIKISCEQYRMNYKGKQT